MAKFECTLQGDYDEALSFFHNGILNGSTPARYDAESYFQSAGVRCTVRVYEWYSLAQGWLTMTLTLMGDGEKLYLSGITTTGGRFANRSEERFLDTLRKLVPLW